MLTPNLGTIPKLELLKTISLSFSKMLNLTTHEVGTKSANGLGIFDMSGNVWEWCSDWNSSDYYSNSSQNNPQGPSSGTYHVIRGGSWTTIAITNVCSGVDTLRAAKAQL